MVQVQGPELWDADGAYYESTPVGQVCKISAFTSRPTVCDTLTEWLASVPLSTKLPHRRDTLPRAIPTLTAGDDLPEVDRAANGLEFGEIPRGRCCPIVPAVDWPVYTESSSQNGRQPWARRAKTAGGSLEYMYRTIIKPRPAEGLAVQQLREVCHAKC